MKPAHKVSTTKQVNRIPAPIPLKNTWTSLTIQEVGKQPSTHQTTTIGEPMEVSTKPRQCQTITYGKEFKTISEQETRTGKGSGRPSTSYKCLDKATRAINDGVSGSYVSKSFPFGTIGQARPTSRQATSNTPRKWGTNGRCTGNHTNCTHRCNISIKEDFCREHSSSTGTQENNRGSHGCYQHTHRIDDMVCYNGHFQGNQGCSHTVCSTSNGPFQDHSSSHPVCSSNGPFQDHSCSHTVCVVGKGHFQDHSGSQSGSTDNGPFQDQSGSQSVCPDNGPFQDNTCSHPVSASNGPIQDHSCSHTACVGNGPFQDQSGSHSACPDNGPFQDHSCSHSVSSSI